ncbi:testis-expressed protein 264 homolog [Aplochiton taeniatus]
MSEWLLIAVFLILLMSLIVVGYILYSGLLSEINIRTGSPPIKNITIAYKFKQGPFKECGPVFTESCRIGPKLSCIGLFYDDPKKVPESQCRWAAGSILSEGDAKPSEELLQLYENFGFRVFSFPEVTHVVTTSFPYRTRLSILLGAKRVYPRLDRYIKERKLCAHPFVEIYRGDRIHYLAPLARQGDFYVHQVRPAERRLSEEESGEESDNTGADSNSEYSYGSGVLLSDSREASLAPSTVPSLLRRRQGSRDNHSDQSSVASSFEELDLAESPAEQKVERRDQANGSGHDKNPPLPAEDMEVVAGGEE